MLSLEISLLWSEVTASGIKLGSVEVKVANTTSLSDIRVPLTQTVNTALACQCQYSNLNLATLSNFASSYTSP